MSTVGEEEARVDVLSREPCEGGVCGQLSMVVELHHAKKDVCILLPCFSFPFSHRLQ